MAWQDLSGGFGHDSLVLSFQPMMLLGLKYLSLWMALFCHACFAWGSTRHFRRSGGTRRLQRRLLWLTVLSGAVQCAGILFENHGTVNHVVAGGILFGLSMIVFWSAVIASRSAQLELFFTRQEPGCILRTGPYRYIRHPFYTSYLLAWTAGAVASNEPLLGLLIVFNGAIYLSAALREERQFDESELASDYAAYRRSTGMFWPGFGWIPENDPAPTDRSVALGPDQSPGLPAIPHLGRLTTPSTLSVPLTPAPDSRS